MIDATTVALYQNIADSEAMDQETPDKNEISETKYFLQQANKYNFHSDKYRKMGKITCLLI